MSKEERLLNRLAEADAKIVAVMEKTYIELNKRLTDLESRVKNPDPPDEVNTPDSDETKLRNMLIVEFGFKPGDIILDKLVDMLLYWRKQSLLALIGEDDDFDEEDTDFSFAEQQARNELRAEQRKGIEEPELAPDKSDVRTKANN